MSQIKTNFIHEERIDELHFITIKNFCERQIQRIIQATDWRKNICKRHTCKGLTRNIQRTLKIQQWNMQSYFKKWARDLNRHLAKEDTQMRNNHIKRSYVIREMLIRTTMSYLSTPVRMANAGRVCSNRNSSIARGNEGMNGTATLEHGSMASYKTKHTLTISSSDNTPWSFPKADENLCAHRTLHTMFTAVLFISAKCWKQPRCRSVGQWSYLSMFKHKR